MVNLKKGQKKFLWLMFFIFVWEIIGIFEWVHPLILPRFTAVFLRFVEGIIKGSLLLQGIHSIKIVFFGLGIGCFLGLVFASLDYFFPTLQALFELLAAMLHPLPGVVILPIVLLFAGVGVEGICLVIIHNVLWSFYLNVKKGFKTIPREYVEVAQNNGAKKWQLWFYVLLPLSREHMKTGVHIGWARGWRGLISAEMIFGSISQIGGLGWYMYQRRAFMDTAGMYAGIIFVMLIGLIVEGVASDLNE